MTRRHTLAGFIGVCLAVAVVLAFFVSPYASSQPDGLERVATDAGFADEAGEHAFADGPLADYAVVGVEDDRLSTGLSGLVGVVLCLAVGAGLLIAVRRARPGPAPARSRP
jgi:hypothetical protein